MSTAQLQYALAIVLLRVLGAPLSWKKLEFEDTIEWNGWAIQPNMMLAHLPSVKHEKITALIISLREHPSRKGLEKIIGIILWATSMVHHTRFLLTSLYRDLYSILATNYSIEPTRWQEFLSVLNEDAIISQKNKLHFPVGARVVDFRHQTITSKSQLPQDVPIERHAWVRLRDPLTDKRKLSTESQDTLSWVQKSLLPMLRSIPLNRCSHLTIEAAADAFAIADSTGIGGWVQIGNTRFWFSQLWSKSDLETHLPIHKELQRYITSWEALAQLCIVLSVNRKCECRPGLISIQPGSDNTGAEANINHGFSTTEILSDIIKLVSTTQMQLNVSLHVHHIPGEKNIEADDLSRGRVSNFDPMLRVDFHLEDIFAPMSFPQYLNNIEQWDTTIHPLAKGALTEWGILKIFVPFQKTSFTPRFFFLFLTVFDLRFCFLDEPSKMSDVFCFVYLGIINVPWTQAQPFRFTLDPPGHIIAMFPTSTEDYFPPSPSGSWMVISQSDEKGQKPLPQVSASSQTSNEPILITTPRSTLSQNHPIPDSNPLPTPQFHPKSKLPRLHYGGLPAPAVHCFRSSPLPTVESEQKSILLQAAAKSLPSPSQFKKVTTSHQSTSHKDESEAERARAALTAIFFEIGFSSKLFCEICQQYWDHTLMYICTALCTDMHHPGPLFGSRQGPYRTDLGPRKS